MCKTIRPKWPSSKSTTNPATLEDMISHIDSQSFSQFWVTSPPADFIHLVICCAKQYNQSDLLQNQEFPPSLFRIRSPTLIPRVWSNFERLHRPPTLLTWIIWCAKQYDQTDLLQNQQPTSSLFRTCSPTLIPRVSRNFEWLHHPPTLFTLQFGVQNNTTKLTSYKIHNQHQISSGYVRPRPSPDFGAVFSDFTAH